MCRVRPFHESSRSPDKSRRSSFHDKVSNIAVANLVATSISWWTYSKRSAHAIDGILDTFRCVSIEWSRPATPRRTAKPAAFR